MLLRINNHYFSWKPERLADVIASLASGHPFVSYPGATRVQSTGTLATLSLDGRATSLANHALSEHLRRAQQELAHKGPESPSP